MALKHLRSSTADKRPQASGMSDGQLAMNTASGSPGLFFKNEAGSLVKIGPVHVGSGAPNAVPASGGTAGNCVGEQWLDTSGGTYVFKIWDGTEWRSEAGEFVNSTGDTMTGDLVMNNANVVFEGSVDDGFETTLTVVNPTADRTITLPNVTGTVVTTGDSGTVTSTMIANSTIVNANISTSAAIAGTKISPNFGSQTIQTTGVISAASGTAAAPSVSIGTTNNGIYSPGADQVAISTSGTGRLFVDSSGRVGIGTTSPGSALEINAAASTSPFIAKINTSEVVRIDSTGRLLVGTSSALNVSGALGGEGLQVAGAGSASNVSLSRWQANSSASALTFTKSRGATVGTNAIVSSGDEIGRIQFNAADGTGFITAGRILAEVDGTPGTDDMPCRLVFLTTADGASSPTERLRITSAGHVGINTTAPAATAHVGGNIIISNVDLANASYDSISFSVTAQETNPIGLFFSPDGSKMFVIGNTGDDVNEYTLSTPWDVSSASYVTVFSIASQDTGPSDIYFRADGRKMYILGNTNDSVYQYTLSTPWSVSSAAYDSVSYSVATEELTPTGLFFKPDGLAFYIVGSSNDTVYRYNLSTAWDVSTATLANSFSVTGQEGTPQALTFTADGSRLFVMGSTGDDINIYNLTTPWDITTASFVTVFSVSAQENAPSAIYIRPDGTKFYIVGTTNDTVYQYTIPSAQINLTGTANINGSADIAQNLAVRGTASIRENVFIDSSARLLVGTSTSLGSNYQVQVAGTTDPTSSLSLHRYQDGANCSVFDFNKSRGASVGTDAVVVSDDRIGIVNFRAYDGSAYLSAARIEARVDGTPGTDDMPGRLAFLTTADGASSPTERMRITSDGKVGIGTTSPSERLDIGNGIIRVINNTVPSSEGDGAAYFGKITGGAEISHNSFVAIRTSSTERCRIDSSGRLLVGTTSAGNLRLNQKLAVVSTGSGNTGGASLTSYSGTNGGDAPVLDFQRSVGTADGSFTEVATNYALGYIVFRGADGVGWSDAAQISAEADGDWTTSGDTTDSPGRLVFSTTADGASSPTEALRITNDRVIAYNQPNVTSKSAAATLTITELKTGIIQYTGAAATLTLPTGTLSEGGFSGIYTNMTFEWSVINTGSGTCTIGAGTAHTIVGGVTVAAGASGRFASRRTAANTFVTYRLS